MFISLEFLVLKSSLYLRETAASVMPVVALTLPVVLGMAGLGVDASSWLMAQRNLQTAADAAALAGAWEAGRGYDSKIDASAEKEAGHNGFAQDVGTIAVAYTEGSGASVVGDSVQVTLNQEFPVYFLKIVGWENIAVEAEATAAVSSVGDEFCILSLDRSVNGALKTSGTVDLTMPDCGIAVNSASERGMTVNGNVEISVRDVHLSGDYVIMGNSAELTYEDLIVGAPPIVDPYADLAVPSFAACSNHALSHPTRVNSSTTLNPGVYCGGLVITGNNTVTLNPGTYIMAGGDFDVSGGGSLIANGVTIILTNGGGTSGTSANTYGRLNVTGGREVTLRAQTSGTYAGLAVFQDRRAPTSVPQGNFLTGTSSVKVDGVLYLPSQELNYGGNVGTATTGYCTRMISNTVVLHGTPFLGNDCAGHTTRPIGNPVIRLIG